MLLQGDLPNPGIKPVFLVSPALREVFNTIQTVIIERQPQLDQLHLVKVKPKFNNPPTTKLMLSCGR